MSAEIEIESSSLSAEELRLALSAHVSDAQVPFKVRDRTNDYRLGIDPTVLVAALSGGAAALSALITGMFALAAARRSGSAKIVIRGTDGRSIEFPADTPHEEIPHLVELTRQLDSPRIELP